MLLLEPTAFKVGGKVSSFMHKVEVQSSLISIRSWWSSLFYYTVICATFSNCIKTLNILTDSNCSQGILSNARHVMKLNSLLLLLLIICIILLHRSCSHGSWSHCMMHKARTTRPLSFKNQRLLVAWHAYSLTLNFHLSKTWAMLFDLFKLTLQHLCGISAVGAAIPSQLAEGLPSHTAHSCSVTPQVLLCPWSHSLPASEEQWASPSLSWSMPLPGPCTVFASGKKHQGIWLSVMP